MSVWCDMYNSWRAVNEQGQRQFNKRDFVAISSKLIANQWEMRYLKRWKEHGMCSFKWTTNGKKIYEQSSKRYHVFKTLQSRYPARNITDSSIFSFSKGSQQTDLNLFTNFFRADGRMSITLHIAISEIFCPKLKLFRSKRPHFILKTTKARMAQRLNMLVAQLLSDRSSACYQAQSRHCVQIAIFFVVLKRMSYGRIDTEW